jgi:peptidoglycan/xylan/chitin deacetylase (PgdA/CDA1 family)
VALISADIERAARARDCDLATSDDVIAGFALARPERHGPLSLARARGKLSRLLARRVVSKALTMRNAKPVITFTFDDAPASACETGAPLLERYEARGTYYISGGGCGVASPGGQLATAAQLKTLCAAGHEIGCHTFSHAAVDGIGHDALFAELDRNRAFLQSLDPRIVVRNFAYPYGDLSFRAKHDLEGRFHSCRSLIPGVNFGIADLGALKSCELQDASIGRRGVGEIIGETVRRNGWLVFTCHDVQEKPSRFGVSPELLEFAVQAARVRGCDILTVADALRRLGDVDA